MSILNTIWTLISIFIRRLIKSFLRRTTKLCELQRLCYGKIEGAPRSIGVEKSIQLSRSKVLKKIDETLTKHAEECRLEREWITFEHAIEATCLEKKINVKIHADFISCYRTCLIQIYAYKQLAVQLSSLRLLRYDPNNDLHVEKLRQVWDNLMIDEDVGDKNSGGNSKWPPGSVPMVGKHWRQIGFQGDDPSTDFRGMGLLGLENMLYLSSVYPVAARHIWSHSLHPKFGFPWACVGINLTHLAYSLFMSGHLKTHFYNAHFRVFTYEDFNKVYCYMFVKFDKLWLESKPESIMEFNHVKDMFEEYLMEQLSHENCLLKWDPQVETL